ncbi:MAG: hypothetical protein M3N30_00460, partial [Bacteroidota bacterium]|nr:hypothetical protein [Bacteroidota bacterium]
MFGKAFIVFITFLSILSFKADPPGTVSFESILSAYNRVNRAFNTPNTSSLTDSACMDGFRRIIADLNNLPKKRSVDSLLYQAYYKLGVLYEVYKDYPKATASYLQAI